METNLLLTTILLLAQRSLSSILPPLVCDGVITRAQFPDPAGRHLIVAAPLALSTPVRGSCIVIWGSGQMTTASLATDPWFSNPDGKTLMNLVLTLILDIT